MPSELDKEKGRCGGLPRLGTSPSGRFLRNLQSPSTVRHRSAWRHENGSPEVEADRVNQCDCSQSERPADRQSHLNPAAHPVLRQTLCAVHLFNSHVLELRPVCQMSPQLYYVLQAHHIIAQCSGPSMYPTLSLSGDLILNSRLALALNSLQRGQLVTAVSPLNPSHQVLKRVVGLGGDTVLVDPSGEHGERDRWVKVPKGSVWLAGDNASNSIDSRDYGPVPEGLLKGVVIAKVSWPAGAVAFRRSPLVFAAELT